MDARDADARRGSVPVTLTHSTPSAATNFVRVRGLRLTIEQGAQAGRTWSSLGDRCTIGSHPRCDLVIDDPTVSRFHCEVRIGEDRAVLRDTGSRNGTLVDDVRILEAFLADGSRVRIGRTVIRVDYAERDNDVAISELTRFGNMIGESVAMRSMFGTLARAAGCDATVLLEGETGTGKTVAARAIHDASPRAGRPFIVIDCGALPANLLESELFGHERGAFTGAETRRVGGFEAADGGTVFLDEIGELPIELQPKLLGALESRTIRRVGSNEQRPIDVRIIAATNRDLRSEVNAGRFRSDLYYRLAVLTIHSPALRERPEDIASLSEHILESLSATRAQIEQILTRECVERMRREPWPGNTRQLRNYLERCLVLEAVVPMPEAVSTPAGATIQVDTQSAYADARRQAIADFERVYLREALRRHNRIPDAAADAGLERTYFYRLLRRHGLNRGDDRG